MTAKHARATASPALCFSSSARDSAPRPLQPRVSGRIRYKRKAATGATRGFRELKSKVNHFDKVAVAGAELWTYFVAEPPLLTEAGKGSLQGLLDAAGSLDQHCLNSWHDAVITVVAFHDEDERLRSIASIPATRPGQTAGEPYRRLIVAALDSIKGALHHAARFAASDTHGEISRMLESF